MEKALEISGFGYLDIMCETRRNRNSKEIFPYRRTTGDYHRLSCNNDSIFIDASHLL